MSEMAWPETASRVELPALGVVSAWFGVALTGLTAVDRITRPAGQPSVMAPLLSVLEFILLALVMASLLLLAVSRQRRLAALPLIVNLGTLLIIGTVPFDGIWQELGFRWRWRSYQEVAAQITSGSVDVADGLVDLPPEYRFVSADGRLYIDRRNGITRLFFFTEWASRTRFAGYYYRSDGLPPQPGDFGGQWHYVAQQRPFWFYCVSDG